MTKDEVFAFAVEVVLENEGGYVNDPNDPGLETHWGISKRAYPELDIKSLTREDALVIYRRDYFDALQLGVVPPAFAVVALDAAVNSGVGRVNGWIAERPQNYVSLSTRRLSFLADLSLFTVYGRGWTRRVARVLEAAHKLANEPIPEA